MYYEKLIYWVLLAHFSLTLPLFRRCFFSTCTFFLFFFFLILLNQNYTINTCLVISNQRWNNVVYVPAEIYKVEQRQINVVYFNVDTNNVRQHWNNVVILNIEFHNVDRLRNKVLDMTIFKKLKRAKKYFWASKKRWLFD